MRISDWSSDVCSSDLTMSDELDPGVLAESFAEMLGAEWPREKAVAWSQAPALFAEPLWEQMAALSWTALTVPEAYGGLGLGMEAAAAPHAALGAAAAPVPIGRAAWREKVGDDGL